MNIKNKVDKENKRVTHEWNAFIKKHGEYWDKLTEEGKAEAVLLSEKQSIRNKEIWDENLCLQNRQKKIAIKSKTDAKKQSAEPQNKSTNHKINPIILRIVKEMAARRAERRKAQESKI